ncbi:conserved hypothetical protein, steroid delta-isomerase-related [Quadrisphaera granulorum]|uniref:Steroid delta-isomerase-like uncharacterized protein n=1 Tax=Quadrisphaera granulorum TaxID=317664 RepID=A0A316AAT7_9ACTN|nr:ester cyclase [Quadrisphaera granulorum]PWJ54328.1 steroid delta-isomerase-like uncharacterized protein [Quadrisphaera granulorum]SZE96100.1 conserved hypothetical protein, steroid delta-isomerase-related [Quadrisphaera granulorum]
MTDDDDRAALITRVWAAAWDHGDVDAFDELLAPTYRRLTGPQDDGLDLDGYKATVTATRTAFPDFTTTVDDVVVSGDRAAIRWRSSGTHAHSFLGVPPTHRRVEVSGATFARFEGGRIVREDVTWDPRSLLSALGIISIGQDA